MDKTPENSDNLQPWLDPELDARVILSVLGEASDVEESELNRLLKEHPELELFKRRMEAVHSLICDAERGVPDEEGQKGPEAADDWKLSSERRDVLHRAFAGKGNATEEKAVELDQTPSAQRRKARVWWLTGLGAAASLAVLGMVSMVSKSGSLSS